MFPSSISWIWYVIFILQLINPTMATKESNPLCPETCSLELCSPDPSLNLPCALPENVMPGGCVGDYCCIGCENFMLYFTTNDTIQCPCHKYQTVACMAPNCQPCAMECLPWYLRYPLFPGPLGTGLLCCGDTCNDCCSHEDSGECCNLECPCVDPGSDCPYTPKVSILWSLFEAPTAPSLYVPLLMMASLPVISVFTQFCITRSNWHNLTSKWFSDYDLTIGGSFGFVIYILANFTAFFLTLHGWSYRTFEKHWVFDDYYQFITAAFASVCSFNIILVSLPASRTPILAWVFGIQFNDSIKWHRWFGYWFIYIFPPIMLIIFLKKLFKSIPILYTLIIYCNQFLYDLGDICYVCMCVCMYVIAR